MTERIGDITKIGVGIIFLVAGVIMLFQTYPNLQNLIPFLN